MAEVLLFLVLGPVREEAPGQPQATALDPWGLVGGSQALEDLQQPMTRPFEDLLPSHWRPSQLSLSPLVIYWEGLDSLKLKEKQTRNLSTCNTDYDGS
ncbi:hypothetical protein AOLI_G00275920 [Acnodon oligacanthus]